MLTELVRLQATDQAAEDPFFLFPVEPPAPGPPVPAPLRELHALCGGGQLGDVRVLTPTELPDRQPEYQRLGPARRVPRAGRLRGGVDGTPVVLDTVSGLIRSYYWRDAWERPEQGWTKFRFESLEGFLTWLFDPGQGSEDWRRLLAVLESSLRDRPRK